LAPPADPFDNHRLDRAPLNARANIRDALEEYELSQLRMVGTLGNHARRLALIQDPEQRIYLVAPGRRMGPDQGVVEQISDEEIRLREFVAGPDGKPHERSTRLYLEKK
jgi:type IV pilus assembly protein PilP